MLDSLPGGNTLLGLLPDDVLAPLVHDWFFLVCGMSRARKTFAPQAGLGSQTVKLALHRALLEAGLTVLDQ